jgi:SAM-dependent methyltransferase
MVFDAVRNRAYRDALRGLVHPSSVVLDLGAGVGLHGLLAAAMGARRVYLVDPSPVLEIAREIARRNQTATEVIALRGRIEDVVLPERVDVIVSVFTGNFLLGEDLLPSLFLARDRFLRPDGVLLPDLAVMEAAPVSDAAYHARHIACWSSPVEGLDLSAARHHAANLVHYPERGESTTLLAPPADLQRIDLRAAERADCRAQVCFEIERSGTCHGILGWFRIRLGGAWLSTSPGEPDTHWSRALLPLDPPLELEIGDRLTFGLTRPQSGDWTWTVETGGNRQRHSTFWGTPRRHDELLRAAPTYTPARSRGGEAAWCALERFDGRTPSRVIADSLAEAFPDRFRDAEEAAAFVRGLIGQFSPDASC